MLNFVVLSYLAHARKRKQYVALVERVVELNMVRLYADTAGIARRVEKLDR